MTVRSDYDIHLSRPEWGSIDVVCQKHVSPNHAVQGPTIIEHDSEGFSEEIKSIVIEFAGILLRVENLGDQRTASHLVDLLTHASLEMNIVKR